MEMTHDDWFFDSISRYKNLNMFELERPIQQIEAVGSNSICVASSDTNSHQLLQLSLPSKLLLQVEGGSSTKMITSDLNLKIKCGTFTEKMCYQIKTVDESKVAVSHFDMKNVSMYSLSSDSDEMKKLPFNIEVPYETPMLAINGSHMWLTKKRADQMFLFDINIEKPVQCFKLDERHTTFECDERVVPIVLSPNVVALGRQVTGGFCMFDLREPPFMRQPSGWQFETPCHGPGYSESPSFWCFSSLLECSKDFSDISQGVCYGKVSKTGSLMLYDTRNLKVPAYINASLGINSADKAPIQMRFKPGNRECVSVSGFNGNVYVYQVHKEEDPKLIFTHDGHKHVEGHSSEVEVTSHIWSKVNNLVISSADNGTIQMWQFEQKEVQ